MKRDITDEAPEFSRRRPASLSAGPDELPLSGGLGKGPGSCVLLVLIFLLISFRLADAYEIKLTTSQDNAQCLSCHSGENKYLEKFPKNKRELLAVDEHMLSGSAHRLNTCTDCHSGLNQIPHEKTGAIVDCTKCHSSDITVNGKEQKYSESIHFAALKKGSKEAATCTSCHGTHDILEVSRPDSRVNRAMIPKTCGTCHSEIFSLYERSIHGQAWLKKVGESAVCTDCHGEHQILAPAVKESSVSKQHIPETCSKCHANEKLNVKYGIGEKKISTYLGSFHGIALEYGDVTVANCASCHGYHDILPSSDPSSSISKGNLARTCGHCHPGMGENVAKGNIHVAPTPRSDIFAFYIKLAYTLIIGSMIPAFAALIIIDLYGRYRRSRLAMHDGAEAAKEES